MSVYFKNFGIENFKGIQKLSLKNLASINFILGDNMFDEILNKLASSKFRSSFTLREKEIKYINDKGIDVVKKHAYDFVSKRISPREIDNDGKQTPMKGHPVFIAQHATATCCRGCLYKWHKISKDKQLNDEEIIFIVNLIMKWISIEFFKKNK